MAYYLKTLLKAISSIEMKNCAKKGKEKWMFINERSFAYELYRSWCEYKPDDLVINAEITKINKEEYKHKAKELFGKDVKKFLPDMVLHGGQDDLTRQEIICEIKDNKYLRTSTLSKDLKKLKAYTTNNGVFPHEFNVGCFILVNGDASNIAKKLSDEDLPLISNSKIIFLVVNIIDEKAVPQVLYPIEIFEIRNSLKK